MQEGPPGECQDLVEVVEQEWDRRKKGHAQRRDQRKKGQIQPGDSHRVTHHPEYNKQGKSFNQFVQQNRQVDGAVLMAMKVNTHERQTVQDGMQAQADEKRKNKGPAGSGWYMQMPMFYAACPIIHAGLKKKSRNKQDARRMPLHMKNVGYQFQDQYTE